MGFKKKRNRAKAKKKKEKEHLGLIVSVVDNSTTMDAVFFFKKGMGQSNAWFVLYTAL